MTTLQLKPMIEWANCILSEVGAPTFAVSTSCESKIKEFCRDCVLAMVILHSRRGQTLQLHQIIGALYKSQGRAHALGPGGNYFAFARKVIDSLPNMVPNPSQVENAIVKITALEPPDDLLQIMAENVVEWAGAVNLAPLQVMLDGKPTRNARKKRPVANDPPSPSGRLIKKPRLEPVANQETRRLFEETTMTWETVITDPEKRRVYKLHLLQLIACGDLDGAAWLAQHKSFPDNLWTS
ncbi:hypothetical protein IWX90DRAFT_415446 [Phyllosticta citrichinensis]|uniref:Uncharacterized protein n=1 Tax=Phyllosticta citrichinensis TaxID=1130410 RepID=A0ABR1XVC2_9PEZI